MEQEATVLALWSYEEEGMFCGDAHHNNKRVVSQHSFRIHRNTPFGRSVYDGCIVLCRAVLSDVCIVLFWVELVEPAVGKEAHGRG
jgi:hypothetical protein